MQRLGAMNLGRPRPTTTTRFACCWWIVLVVLSLYWWESSGYLLQQECLRQPICQRAWVHSHE